MPLAMVQWTSFEPDLDGLARATAEQIRCDHEDAKRQALADALQPLLARSFPGGWWHGNSIFMADFSIEECWPDGADGPNIYALHAPCVSCGRRFHPFGARPTCYVTGGWRWVGLDHQEPHSDYFTACGWCGQPMLFTIHAPQ